MRHDEALGAFLAGDESPEVQAHLSTCPECGRQVATLEARRGALAAPAVWDEPASGAAERFVDVFAGAAVPVPSSRSWRRRKWTIASAVAVVVAVALAAVLLQSGSPPPDWSITLTGTEAAPGAAAVVDGFLVDSGTRVVMRIEALEAAPAGSIYELWFSEGGEHVSAGTFRSGGTVELAVGISRAEYPRVWVTVEETGGDPAPSRTVVFDSG